MIRRGIQIALPILLLACAPKPPVEEPRSIPFELREINETDRYVRDQIDLPPAPIRSDDTVKTEREAILLARKECPHFQGGPETATLHNEFWLVRWGRLQWLFILKKDGTAYRCQEVIED